MKKQFVALLMFAAFGFSVNAQVHPHAIGLRGAFGNFGSGGEISYQHGFGTANRLELDLGFRGGKGVGSSYSHGAISGIYHWVWNIEEGLSWFVGPGAQLGVYNDKYDSNNDGLTLSVGGQIGLEYDFNDLDVPLHVALDTRPMWGFLGGTSGFGYGAALSIRYTF